ncbi:hypothetical protein ACPOL_7237 (plasmid) [Acidisarcina polymorpha]|uniref:Uncharacterized protein n=2 Tax=Acidisarcina polymorpha TaxID=2211140 RepID=A0A2Z5GC97_9BACT|nr:hypothetical protein ACPOL_7237 [Acidisarcina polymorpha]
MNVVHLLGQHPSPALLANLSAYENGEMTLDEIYERYHSRPRLDNNTDADAVAPRPPSAVPDDPHTAQDDLTLIQFVILQTTPLVGGFDSCHLERIHSSLFGDVPHSAPSYRNDVESSVSAILDTLPPVNYLQGKSPEDWSERASTLIHDIAELEPFDTGTPLTLHEFANQLARKNNLSLSWAAREDEGPELAPERSAEAEGSGGYFRRIVMLASDDDRARHSTSRGDLFHHRRSLDRDLPGLFL